MRCGVHRTRKMILYQHTMQGRKKECGRLGLMSERISKQWAPWLVMRFQINVLKSTLPSFICVNALEIQKDCDSKKIEFKLNNEVSWSFTDANILVKEAGHWKLATLSTPVLQTSPNLNQYGAVLHTFKCKLENSLHPSHYWCGPYPAATEVGLKRIKVELGSKLDWNLTLASTVPHMCS